MDRDIREAYPLLATKIYCPLPGDGLVQRNRLQQLLNDSLRVPLALISAPPGYGKTVLASTWAHTQKVAVAWLTLDDEESSLAQFLAYLLAALEKSVNTSAFVNTGSVLAKSELPAINRIAEILINDIRVLDEKLVIILDDYHLVDHQSAVHDLLGKILCHPPGNLHLVVLTRRDPPIMLAKLRANNQLLDIRLANLCFSVDETKSLLRNALGWEVSTAAANNVQQRLEGWGAGIRMVALAARRMENGDHFLQALSGGMQQIQDYLFEEVIVGLEQSALHYLLCSALPHRFCSALLDATASALTLTAPNFDSRNFLDFATHSNMFTIALDSAGEWYRYHNLFRELLLRRVHSTFSEDDVRNATAAAAKWLEQHNYVGDALRLLIDQAMDAEAAELLERHRRAALNEDQWLSLEGWLQKFPATETHRWPAVLLARASLAVFNLDIGLVADLVQQLERHPPEALSPEQLGELNFFRAVPLFWTGEILDAKKVLEQAVTAPMEFGQISGELHMYLAVTRAMTNEFDLALRGLDEALRSNGGKRDIFASRLFGARCYIHYFYLQQEQVLHNAQILTHMAAFDLNSKHVKGWALYLRALSLLNTGRFELARQAAREALQCREFLEKKVLVELYLAIGICSCHLGDTTAITETMSNLQILIDLAPNIHEITELVFSAKARIALLNGDIESALKHSAELPRFPTVGTLLFWLDEPALTWAKVQLADGGESAAQLVLPLVERLRNQANHQCLLCYEVELLIVEAIARSRLQQHNEAIALLNGAIHLAAPSGWSGPFAELAVWFKDLVPDEIKHSEQWAFVQHLWPRSSVVEKQKDSLKIAMEANSVLAPAMEIFTNRELDIIELLAQRYQNKEIADTLFISTHTVNYHLKHIYQKLKAGSRREAVQQATKLGLLNTA